MIKLTANTDQIIKCSGLLQVFNAAAPPDQLPGNQELCGHSRLQGASQALPQVCSPELPGGDGHRGVPPPPLPRGGRADCKQPAQRGQGGEGLRGNDSLGAPRVSRASEIRLQTSAPRSPAAHLPRVPHDHRGQRAACSGES